jgi:gamma-glutamylcyclotransferase (GGCT)/AIG2-like uncharacterized protein YtfP
MTLHFAYGSNMSRAGMKTRCPGARAIGTGALRGFRFIIMTNGYASVARASDATVHGVLWRVTPRDLAALNAYESVDSGLYRRVMLPVAAGTGTVSALVYLGCEEQEGGPRPGYMNVVVEAAREWELPAAYISGLERWSPGGWQGSRATETGETA